MQKTASLKNAGSSFSDLKNFTQFDYSDFTLYSLYVSEYTDSRPYFLYYTIEVNKKTREEKSGFLQFRPQLKQQQLVVKTFTGQLQLINNDNMVIGGATFNNGNMTANSLGGTTTCTTTIVAVNHPCSHGGNHELGENCQPGFQNDAYLSFTFFVDCWTTFPTNGVGGGGGTGGGGGVPYTQTFYNNLSPKQKEFLDIHPSIKNDVFTYISSYGASEQWIKQLIDNMISSGLVFNINYSKVSPFNIDMTSIQGSSTEEVKFRKVYDKLLFSPKFR